MNRNILIGGAVLSVAIIGAFLWFFLLRPNLNNNDSVSQGTLEVGSSNTTGVSSNTPSINETEPLNIPEPSKASIFRIAEGPVTSATFVQTFNPTTTLARYVLQENGHVLDQPIDIPGSLARAVSNTTIPATARALWGAKGASLLMQYNDDTAIKTVSLIFPQATSSRSNSVLPVKIQFLPNNILDLAVSPDGKQIVYLLEGASGSEGYTANIDGSAAKKLFSFGLSELLVSWPTQNTILLGTKSNQLISGAIFSVDSKSGGIVPLIYGNGLTAIADRAFNAVVYQTASAGAASRSTYLHDLKKGTDVSLSFDPIPEKCTWSNTTTTTLYCAVSVQFVGASYLDLWHRGLASAADSLVSYVLLNNSDAEVVATPGSSDGGEASDILELAVSPDDKYLLFIKKGDRSLWGVRLTQ